MIFKDWCRGKKQIKHWLILLTKLCINNPGIEIKGDELPVGPGGSFL